MKKPDVKNLLQKDLALSSDLDLMTLEKFFKFMNEDYKDH